MQYYFFGCCWHLQIPEPSAYNKRGGKLLLGPRQSNFCHNDNYSLLFLPSLVSGSQILGATWPAATRVLSQSTREPWKRGWAVMRFQMQFCSILRFSLSILVKCCVHLRTSSSKTQMRLLEKKLFQKYWLFSYRFIAFKFDRCSLLSVIRKQ